MGDGIENGDIDQFMGGLQTYVGACSAFAAWRMSRACFIAGTPVLALNPTVTAIASSLSEVTPPDFCLSKPIETIRKGDYVLSRLSDDSTGLLYFARVDQTFVNETELLVELETRDDSGWTGSITTTAGRPFWVSRAVSGSAPLADLTSPHINERRTYREDAIGQVLCGRQGWVFANDLVEDDELCTVSTDRTTSWVSSVSRFAVEQTRVYNFRVAGGHTYFVSPGESVEALRHSVWVHNQNSEPKKGTKSLPK